MKTNNKTTATLKKVIWKRRMSQKNRDSSKRSKLKPAGSELTRARAHNPPLALRGEPNGATGKGTSPQKPTLGVIILVRLSDLSSAQCAHSTVCSKKFQKHRLNTCQLSLSRSSIICPLCLYLFVPCSSHSPSVVHYPTSLIYSRKCERERGKYAIEI